MVKTRSASKLPAFAVITPLFGVAAGYVIMQDQLRPLSASRRYQRSLSR
jgi:hypothetical protein